MSQITPRLLKGFRDFNPNEQSARQVMFSKIQTIFEQFGFLPLSTPALEYKEILMGKYGDDEKLIYSFNDHGQREVAMRYDLTVPLARYVAQNQGSLTFPFKRYQIAPVWRADNTQKGRWREFFQCDIDVVGADSALVDAEIIACMAKSIEAFGVSNYKIRINDRIILKDFSQTAIRIIDKADKIGVNGVVLEMTERGATALEIEKVQKLLTGKLIAKSERLQETMELLEGYSLQGIVEFDPTVARGLDYYSGVVFETVLLDKPEYGSVCSGGRYNGLLSGFSSQPFGAVGGSIGVDRLFAVLTELGLLSEAIGSQVLVLNLDLSLQTEYIKILQALRSRGIRSEVYYEAVKLDKQFKYAERNKILYVIILGDEELKTGKIKVKNMLTREQVEVEDSALVEYFQQIFSAS